ncbi:MAG: sugar phosphate isomerase/epimerase [Myxococcales bacterium]|nr:sugar phosphate isomerase/epimerase [Myxococcales bacterium]MCB9545199.1 sugar phosphate isomerase/epimerase [Myxococcales bacterium]
MMRLAYSTNGFAEVDLPTAIRRIGAHGYAGVELLADRPHWLPGHGLPELRGVKRALGDAGLAVSNINANTAMALWPAWVPETLFEPSLSNHDASIRARRMDYTRAALDLAAAVGAPCLSVTSGRTEGAIPPGEGHRIFAESLAILAEEAAARGVRLGVEYEPGLLVETAAELRAIIDAVDHPSLGANLDLGHAICAGEDPVESIGLLAGRIWNVHLEDIAAKKHFHLIPGEGDVDFHRLLRALHASGYGGFVTVELYTCSHRADEACTRALAHLAPCLADVLGGPAWSAAG